MEKILERYAIHGRFEYQAHQALKDVCNAPETRAGVYLVYDFSTPKKRLLYIGASGQKDKDGGIKIRQGGLYDRLVNGRHAAFNGVKRSISWPDAMRKQGIRKIEVQWYVTWGGQQKDFPTDVEASLMDIYLTEYGVKPPWHG
jgi:hypothetical protein